MSITEIERIIELYREGGFEPAAEQLLKKGDAARALSNAILVMRRLKEEAMEIKKKEDELTVKRRELTGFEDQLRAFSAELMAENDIEKLDTEAGRVFLREFVSNEVFEEKLIPARFWSKKTILDKQKLKKALESGEEVPGARLIKSRRITIA